MMESQGQMDFEDLPTRLLLERVGELARADSEETDEDLWIGINVLRGRPEEAVFSAAGAWCVSADAQERSLGASILGQLGHGVADGSPFGDRSVPLLRDLLNDRESSVLDSAISALGHLAPAGVEWDADALRGASQHEDPKVRHSVAFAFCHGFCDRSEVAVELMKLLCEDEDAEVRNWATFGLGVQSEVDDVEVRDLLRRRLAEDDMEIRGEALVALAKRREPGIEVVILEELSGSETTSFAIESAIAMPRAEFVEALAGFHQSDPEDADLNEALRLCRDCI